MPGVLVVQPEEREWVSIWGPRCGIVEKRYLTKDDGYPVTSVLRKFPKQKNLLADGYQPHSHPSLELCFVLTGHLNAKVDGVGEIELRPQQLAVMPAGVKHAAVEALEDTLLFVTYCPPYDKPMGSEPEVEVSSGGDKFLLLRAADTPMCQPWGPKGTVTEKRILTREHGYGIGFTLRYIAGAKELAEKGLVDLHSAEGYTYHSHPCLEAGYIATGHFSGGEADNAENARPGVFMAVRAHEKHGAKTPGDSSIIAIVNYPPFGREPVVVVKDGIPEEG